MVSETAASGNALVAEFLPFSGSVDVGAIAIDSACSSFDTAESAFKGVSVKSRAVVTLAIQREDDHWTLRVSRDQNVLVTTSVRGKWIFPAVRYQVSQQPPISSPLIAFSSLLVAPTSLFPLHLLRPFPVPVAFPLSFRRPITFTDPLFTSSDFSILPAGKAFSLGVLTVRLHTDGLRGFATIVNRVAELTLYVVRDGKLDRRYLPELERLHQEGKFKHLCIVLNDSHIEKKKYGYGYGYSYGYGYGYGDGYYSETNKKNKK